MGGGGNQQAACRVAIPLVVIAEASGRRQAAGPAAAILPGGDLARWRLGANFRACPVVRGTGLFDHNNNSGDSSRSRILPQRIERRQL